MNRSFYLLTAFGKDRPGMVAQVTRMVFQAAGNIEDASMTRLGGEFAMMLVIGLPRAASVSRLKVSGLNLTVKPIAAQEARSARPTHATHLISVYGTDHPGIVYRVAEILARHRVNITDLNTKVVGKSGPPGVRRGSPGAGGKPLYVMMLEVQIASKAKAAALKKTLARLGRSRRLEIVLHDIEPVAL